MAKTAADWAARPKFPATHYVDSRIYTDPAIFAEEREKLFRPSWISPSRSDPSRCSGRESAPRSAAVGAARHFPPPLADGSLDTSRRDTVNPSS